MGRLGVGRTQPAFQPAPSTSALPPPSAVRRSPVTSPSAGLPPPWEARTPPSECRAGCAPDPSNPATCLSRYSSALGSACGPAEGVGQSPLILHRGAFLRDLSPGLSFRDVSRLLACLLRIGACPLCLLRIGACLFCLHAVFGRVSCLRAVSGRVSCIHAGTGRLSPGRKRQTSRCSQPRQNYGAGTGRGSWEREGRGRGLREGGGEGREEEREERPRAVSHKSATAELGTINVWPTEAHV